MTTRFHMYKLIAVTGLTLGTLVSASPTLAQSSRFEAGNSYGQGSAYQGSRDREITPNWGKSMEGSPSSSSSSTYSPRDPHLSERPTTSSSSSFNRNLEDLRGIKDYINEAQPSR